MLRAVVLVIVCCVRLSLIAQPDYFASLVSTTDSSATSFKTEFNSFVHDLKQKSKHLSETALLHKSFSEAHRKFLKHYHAYSPFTDLFVTKSFDCLSGTAFFSLLLNELGYRYRIIETNYHIFMIVQTSQGEILLESTDKLNGFVSDPQQVISKIESYRKNELPHISNLTHCYTYNINLFHEVLPSQLQGLLYFNQAVVAYNQRNWSQCRSKLAMAESLYANPRINELKEILKLTDSSHQQDLNLSAAIEY
jgi:hypothetical protein